jgi:hypothetical protein
LHPGENILASVGEDQQLVFMDLVTNKILLRLTLHFRVSCLQFSQEVKAGYFLLLLGCFSGKILVYHIQIKHAKGVASSLY